MRRVIAVIGVLAAVSWASGAFQQVQAFPGLALETEMSCATCHSNPAGGADLTEAGTMFKADGTKPKASAEPAAEYVGSNKCKMCHSKQFKSWAETPHAKALAALSGESDAIQAMAKALDMKLEGSAAEADGCVSCHVVGFKLAGGYPQTEEAKVEGVQNVGCEACHGPGSLHLKAKMKEKKDFINGAVTANMCKNCHTAKTSPKFDFDKYMAKGVHEMKAATSE